MSEQEVLEEVEESEEIEDPEASDEELWSQDEEAEGDTESKGTPQEESEEETESEEEPEDTEDEPEDEEPEEPQHDYEARYKDLEKEFHKRNEESARMREDLNELRLRDVEREQALERARKGLLEETKEPKIDPTDAEKFFNKEDKQTMEEFSELSSTFRKMIQHEMAKHGSTMQEANIQAQERLKDLEEQNKEQNYQNFLRYHESYMLENVGEDYRDIDKDADFQAFVLGSPAMTKMMTESTDPIDHASVMKLFLSTEEGATAWRKPKEEEKEVKASTKRQAKRTAATGLLGNSAPVKSKNIDNLSDEELWEAIPE